MWQNHSVANEDSLLLNGEPLFVKTSARVPPMTNMLDIRATMVGAQTVILLALVNITLAIALHISFLDVSQILLFT